MTTKPTVPDVAVNPDLARQLRRAADKAERAKDDRDALIVQAIEAGGSYREVAKLVGLTHPTVMKIVADREVSPHGS